MRYTFDDSCQGGDLLVATVLHTQLLAARLLAITHDLVGIAKASSCWLAVVLCNVEPFLTQVLSWKFFIPTAHNTHDEFSTEKQQPAASTHVLYWGTCH